MFNETPVSIALTLSNPVPEPQVFLNDGEIVAAFVSTQPEALWFVQQPSDFILTKSEDSKQGDTKAESDCEDCESKVEPELERSFFFKNWFRPAPSVAAVTLVQPAPPPQVIRVPVPAPVVLGTVYQPISLVAGPITTGAGMTGISSPFAGTAFPGQQGFFAGARPSVPMVRPQPLTGAFPSGIAGSNLGINIQQVMRPGIGMHQGIMSPNTGSFTSALGSGQEQQQSSSISSTVNRPSHPSTGAVETGTQGTFESQKVPKPEKIEINVNKVIDVMGQIERS